MAGRANFRAFPGRQSCVVRPRRDGIPWDPLTCPAPGRGDRRPFSVARPSPHLERWGSSYDLSGQGQPRESRPCAPPVRNARCSFVGGQDWGQSAISHLGPLTGVRAPLVNSNRPALGTVGGCGGSGARRGRVDRHPDGRNAPIAGGPKALPYVARRRLLIHRGGVRTTN